MSADDALFHAAEALGPELFAVVDGGKFDDVGQALASVGLSGQPLYLEGADPSVRAAAGHLVTLADRRDLRAVIEIARSREALVIWSWPSGSMALYRHLRTLNLVEIPNEARAEAEAAGEDVSAMPEYEPVLFRHWDSNVLAELLPLLDDKQRSRFSGASAGLTFATADAPRRYPPEGSIAGKSAAGGLLRFTADQMKALRQERAAASRARIAVYLRDVAGAQAAGMDNATLDAWIRHAQASGKSANLRTERAVALWAYLEVMSNGQVGRSEAVRECLLQNAGQEEAALFALAEATVQQAKRGL